MNRNGLGAYWPKGPHEGQRISDPCQNSGGIAEAIRQPLEGYVLASCASISQECMGKDEALDPFEIGLFGRDRVVLLPNHFSDLISPCEKTCHSKVL